MRTKKIRSRDFDFAAFLEAEPAFIEDNFLQEAPDAADTMRYFYGFSREGNETGDDKDFSKWQMEDFKEAILRRGQTIFFPFSSGPDMNGTLNLASGKSIQLFQEHDDVPALGLTDCVGILVSLEDGKFVFKSAVAWGDMTHIIEKFTGIMTDREMNRFLNSFNQETQ